ncbi:MAG: hypothetical protein VZR95_03860 [Alphaproteobacteria bacterium]
MAENTEFTARLKEIAEQNKPLPTDDNAFMKELAESATALDSLDEKSLENLQSLVSNLPQSLSYKQRLYDRISNKLYELQTAESQTESRGQAESSEPKAPEDEKKTPEAEKKTAESAQPTAEQQQEFADFVTQPSYSVAARHKELSEKGTSISPEELAEKEQLELMAKEALALSNPGVVSTENAVALSDYLEIAEKSANLTEEEKENIEKFKPQIEKALKEYDDLNNISRFENLNPEEMDKNEAAWLQKTQEVLQSTITEDNRETFDLLSHLAAQKLKHQAPSDNAEQIIIQEMDDLQAQFAETVRNEVINLGATNKFKMETGLSDEEIAALKISGDKGMFDNDEEKKAYKELTKIREEYLRKYADADISTVAAAVASEELALEDPEKAKKLASAQNKILHKQPLDDEDKKIYQEFLTHAHKIRETTTEAVQVTYAKEIDSLASRTARVTGAKDVTNETKSFLKGFAEKHPKLFTYSKCIALGGSKAALGWAIGQVAGVNGLAAYSAYNTFNTYKKAYKAFQEQTGEKGFKNFIKYLKKEENADTRINLIRSVASTSIAVAFAAVGNATGLAYIPGAKTVANTAVNLTANTAKFFHKLKSYTKNKDGKTKKGLIAAAAGLAVTGTLAAFHFLPDETKEKLTGWTKNLFGGHDDQAAPETPKEPMQPQAGQPDPNKPFDLEEAQKQLRDAVKIDPEAERLLHQKFNDNQFGGQGGGKNLGLNGNGGNNGGNGGNNGGNGGNDENGGNSNNNQPAQVKADQVSYTFDRRKGLFISDTKGVGIHHADTMVKGSQDQVFEGNTTKLPTREAGESNAAYNERVIATVNADIARNAELGNNYHAKLSIQKADGSTIEVKQHVKIKEDNDEIITKLRRKIKTDEDSYSQRTEAHTDKQTNQSYNMTKYRSHQVDSNTVGGDGGKDDKILRAATVGDKKYEIVRDGDTGKKFIVESQRNEHGVYEQVSASRTTMGDKKTLEAMVDKEMKSQAQAASQPAPQPTAPKEIPLSALLATKQNGG